jgi:AAA domain/DnaB-like helicase N terminal domain
VLKKNYTPTPVAPAAPALGRVPPHSVEAEEQLLSACFLDGVPTVARCLENEIVGTSFYVPANRVIYEKILELYNVGKPIETCVVAEELKATGKLDEIGGYPYLTRVSGRIPTTAGAGYFIEKIRELAALRSIIHAATAAVEGCYGYTGATDLPEILSKLKEPQKWAEATLGAWKPVSAASQAKAPTPAPPELIAGMLYEGGTLMMSGASKSMKTYTMIHAGLAVASGSEWMGRKCAKRPVVYLNLELQPFAMEKRVREIAAAMRIDCPDTFYIVNLRGTLVNIDVVEAQLNRVIASIQPGLVIIDPHYKISAASGVDENSNDAQGLLLYRLENAICKKGSALMIAHHFSKGDKSQTKAMDRAAGGGALARWPDVIMTLTEHEEESCCTAEFSLRNFAPIPAFVLRWEYPVWHYMKDIDPTKLKQPGRPKKNDRKTLIPLIPKEGITRPQLVEKAKPSWSKSSVYEAVKELIFHGEIRECGNQLVPLIL